MGRRNRMLMQFSGIVAVVTLAALAWTTLRNPGRLPGAPVPEEVLLSRAFDRLPDNGQGYPEFRHKKTGIVMVRLPGGTVQIGVHPEYRRQFVEEYARNRVMLMARKKSVVVFPDDEEKLSPEEWKKREEGRELARAWLGGPRHDVTLSPFLIAKYELTQEQWTSIMDSNPSRFKIGGERNPVERVSWNECKEFCDKAGLTLPSDAQWEYACRAGSEETFGGTGEINDMAWHQGNSGERTHPVGGKSPNDFGLYDMHGNVAEWCEDVNDWMFYEKPESRGTNPVCRSGSTYRVYRGGAYRDGWFQSRASSRAQADPVKGRTSVGEGSLGFRPVLMLGEGPGE